MFRKHAIVFSIGISLALASLLPAPVVWANHDLTCHELIVGLFSGAVASAREGQNSQFSLGVHVQFDRDGDAFAKGTVVVESGRETSIFIVDPESAVAECSIGEGDLLILQLTLHDLKSGGRAQLMVIPTGGNKVGVLQLADAILGLPNGDVLIGPMQMVQQIQQQQQQGG